MRLKVCCFSDFDLVSVVSGGGEGGEEGYNVK